MNKNKKERFTNRIINANRTELIVILYEMCFEYMAEDDISKSQQIIRRLESDLNFDYELSYQLFNIYTYAERELVKYNIDLNPAHITNTKRILTPLYEAFLEISKQDKSKPLLNPEPIITTTYTNEAQLLN